MAPTTTSLPFSMILSFSYSSNACTIFAAIDQAYKFLSGKLNIPSNKDISAFKILYSQINQLNLDVLEALATKSDHRNKMNRVLI